MVSTLVGLAVGATFATGSAVAVGVDVDAGVGFSPAPPPQLAASRALAVSMESQGRGGRMMSIIRRCGVPFDFLVDHCRQFATQIADNGRDTG